MALGNKPIGMIHSLLNKPILHVHAKRVPMKHERLPESVKVLACRPFFCLTLSAVLITGMGLAGCHERG